MKNENELTTRGETLMLALWEENKPMTISEISRLKSIADWKDITVNKTVQYLAGRNLLTVTGIKKSTMPNAKTYARIFMPAVTKEEYYAAFLKRRGFDENSLEKIAGIIASDGGGQ